MRQILAASAFEKTEDWRAAKETCQLNPLIQPITFPETFLSLPRK